jgi:hypothetical protein
LTLTMANRDSDGPGHGVQAAYRGQNPVTFSLDSTSCRTL